MPLSFDVTDVQKKLQYFTEPPEPQITPEAAQNRAEKYNYTLGPQSPGLDTVTQTIQAGNEKSLRDKLTFEKYKQDEGVKTQIIDAVVKSNDGKGLSLEQYNFIKNLTSDQLKSPDSIFETEYAKKVFSDMLFTNPNPNADINQALTAEPAKTNTLLDIAQGNLANQEIARRKYEEYQKKYEAAPLLGTGPLADSKVGMFLQEWIPFHKNMAVQAPGKTLPVPGSPLGSIPVPQLLGEDVHAQYRAFRHMSPENFAIEFPKRVDEIAKTNVAYALQFIQGYMSETTNDRFWGDIGTVLDYSTLAPVGGASKGAKVGVDVARSVAEAGGKQASIDALKGVGVTVAKDYETYATEYQRITKLHNDELAQLEKIRTEEGKGLSDAEYNAQRNKLIENYSKDLSELQSVSNEHVTGLLKTIKGVTDAAASNSPAKVLASAGKTEEAAIAGAAKAVESEAPTGKAASASFNAEADDLVRHIPSYADPNSILKGPYNLAQFAATALAESVRNIQKSVVEALTAKIGIERLTTDEAKHAALAEAVTRFKKEANINDTIANVNVIPMQAENNPLTNTYAAQFDVTRPGGKLFTGEIEAYSFAKNVLGISDAQTVKQGDGYFLRVSRPYDETSQGVRNALVDTANATPEGKYGVNTTYVAENLRSATQLLGEAQNLNRKVLVHGLQKVSSALANIVEPIQALSKTSRADLNRFLAHLGDDLKIKGPGGDITTLGQFTEKWVQTTGRQPTFKEANAYFATREMYNFDWISRNLSAYTLLSRQGMTKITVLGKDFIGKGVDDLKVLERSDYGILINNGESYYYVSGSAVDSKIREQFARQVAEGYKLVQVGKPFDRPFKDLDGRIINFVLTKDIKHQPLALDIIPYDPSQIVQYDYRHTVVQPRINPIEGRNAFMGDSVLMQAQSAKQAKVWADSLEYVRKTYKDIKDQITINRASEGSYDVGADLSKLHDYITTHLPFTAEQVLEAFDNESIHLDHPITSTPARSVSIDNPAFKATTKVGQDLRKDPYDLVSGVDTLKDTNPVLKLDQQKILDPLIGIARSLNRMARNTYLNDYQIMSAEQFIKEFKDVLDVSPEHLAANPIAYLMEPKWAKNVDPDKLRLAKTYQIAVKNLLESQNFTSQKLGAWRGQMYENLFDKYGAKTDDMWTNWALSKVPDPFRLARAVTQHLKIGMFNVTQFAKQLQTVTIAGAIVGPKVSYQASAAQMLQQVMRLGKPEFIDHFDQLATKLGLRSGDLKAIQELAHKSGLLQVEGEHLYNEDLIDPGIISGWWGKVLDWGQAPWRAGERATRQFSLNAAYLEWRGRNPTAVLNRKAEQEILFRQDVLNVNMTRASQSAIQAGSGGLASDIGKTLLQFASYQMRVWELMTGSTLSRAEKARMFLSQSAFYGIPIGVGTTIPWPWYNTVRQQQLQGNLPDNTNAWMELMTKGIPETMMHMVLGKEYDFNTVMGAPSLSIFSDAAEGDKSLLMTLLGASGTTFGDIIGTTYPAIQALWGVSETGNWNVVKEDFTNILKNVSGVNNAMKLVYAMNTGQALTKAGKLVADVTTIDGFMMAAFGVSPQDIADVGNLITISQNKQAAKDYAGKYVAQYILRWAKSTSPEDREANLRMATRWSIMGGMNGSELQKIEAQTLRSNASLFNQLNNQLLIERLKHGQVQP